MENILEIKDLKTCFYIKDSVVQAVNGVSFNIIKGETFGLVGESGCGKSATCRSILQLIHEPGKIISGSIKYENKELIGLSKNELREIRGEKIGMIFQEPMTALNPVLKIKDQIYESFEKKNMSKKQKYEKALEMMKLVGIPNAEERLEQYPHQFSGGMRQRAMIAIALASQPKILLADEPTTALDVTIQDQIMKLINDLKETMDMSMVLVTHDLGVVAQMCDRVAVMYAGYIVEETDTITLFSNPLHPYTIALMNSIPTGKKIKKRLEPIIGAPPDLAKLPCGCPFQPRCNKAQDICTQELPMIKQTDDGHKYRCHF